MLKPKLNQSKLSSLANPYWMVGLLIICLSTQMYAISPTNKLAVKSATFNSPQSKTIKGKIVSASDNLGIPGANIMVKGTKIVTTTDFDGNYSISVPDSNGILVVSYIGYITQEVKIGTSTTVNVSLKQDISSLNEVIVVGFGTQKKTTLTGSVTQLKGDDVTRSKGTSSAALALQGEAPGVVVTRTSSRPGNDGVNIKIRGDISVNDIGPLILLDGLEIPEWQLSTINPNDIETYSVLKDGAAAIFGTKAAGGVILVTTKKGKRGKMQISYRGETQINFPKDFPVTNLKDWAKMWLEAGDNDEIEYMDANGVTQYAAGNYRFFTRPELLSIIDGTMPMAPDTYNWNGKVHRFSDVNQFDAVYSPTFSQRHDLSFSGGNENATYRTSIGYSNERSPIAFVYDGAKKINFRTNLNYKISDVISTDFIVSYDNRLVDEPTQGVGHGIQDMYLFPLYNPQGQYYDIFGGNNLLAKLDEGGRIENVEEIIRFGTTLNLNFNKYVKGLSFKYNGNFSSRNGNKNARTTSVTMYDWDGNVSYTPTTLLSSSVRINQTKISFQNHVIQGNYLRSFGQHNIGLLAGITAEETQTNNYEMFRSNMTDDDLDDLNTGDVTTQTNKGGSNAVGLVSYIGKINYDYNGIYLLEALGRRDGSSRLHPDFRWKNFYSASAGIRLSEMNFIKKANVFDNLKLRASYGETGSVTGIGTYDYISNMSTGSTQFGSNPTLANTAWIGAITSTDRTWERVATTNFALDFAALKNRLSGTFEYFIRKNNDMLVNITYPQVLGGTAPKTNSGDFTTNGWEASLNWKDKIGENFKYNIGLMVWDSKSEVTRMEGKTAIVKGNNAIVEGKPLNSIYTYKTNGVLTTEDQVLAYYNQYGFADPSNQNVMKAGTLLPKYRSADRLVPGALNRVDANGDGIIDTDDLVYYGDANPHYSFGLRLGMEYKGFDFSAFFQGVGQQNIVRTGALSAPFASWFTNQNSAFLGNTWSENNTDAQYPAMYYNTARRIWNYDQNNDVNVIKASYMRAKVLSVGYSLPRYLLDKSAIKNLRISLTGNDLFVISNVNDGMDPEMVSGASQGSTVPYVSTMLLGLDLTF
ncbi:SusC/RagA family TonB-linked outer membrane protein [Flavobacterium fluviatile]|uniref:SusC/RagA family TonB-linked outer membrane protein n=1 Tax=Flavobacterium fluviatile TaxID=1862387 RepID=UPI001AD6529E|nr:SusC/RagA family TonB-linked outer membrane protein [Flavobacterium fluviatile]